MEEVLGMTDCGLFVRGIDVLGVGLVLVEHRTCQSLLALVLKMLSLVG
jgi:hypothetical protein